MAEATADPSTWWRRLELADEQSAWWRIGPLTLAAHRYRQEWRIGHAWSDDVDERVPDWDFELRQEVPEPPLELDRFVFRRPSGWLRVTPALADRPVVTSPRLPLYLLPGEEATLFVGSPLWARVEVGEPRQLLKEFWVRRPSDTWFGTNRDGELCYASRTHASLEAQDLPVIVRRALTPVLVRNRADTPLRVERMKLPVPYLSLYAGDTGPVWTDSVTMTRSEEGEMTGMEVGRRPGQARGAKLVVGPRIQPEKGLLIRAFSGLFSNRSEEAESA